MKLTIKQALQRAWDAQKAGRFDEAQRIYRAILKSHPLHPDANHNLGILAISLNKVSEALPLLETALESNPRVEQYWISYVDALIKGGQSKILKQTLKKAKKHGFNVEKLSSLAKKPQLAKTKLPRLSSTSPPQDLINALFECYRDGQYQKAEKIAQSITREFPSYQFGWKALGASLKQLGKLSDSLVPLKKSVELDPHDPEAHFNLGNTLRQLGRVNEARCSYEQAIKLKPLYAEAHSNLGNTLEEIGSFDKAELSFREAISLKPNFAEAHNNLGVLLKKVQRLTESRASFVQALAIRPDYAEAHYNLGKTLHEMAKYEEAANSYGQALALKPDFAEAQSSLGIALQKLGKFDEAETCYRKAINIKYDYAEAHSNLGTVLREIGRLEESKESCERALELKPNFAEAYNNLGITQKELGQFNEAKSSYKRAIDLMPEDAECHCNLGNAFQALGEFDEAENSYKRAMSFDPDHAEANCNLSFIYLSQGKLENGFSLYEWRLKRRDNSWPSPRKRFDLGELNTLAGKRFFVYEEQGLGDIIQFSRYLTMLEQNGAIVTFKVARKLHGLLGTMANSVKLTELHLNEDDLDFEAPLMSLPLIFKTKVSTIPSQDSYLYADPKRVVGFANKLDDQSFKIGICWQGATTKGGSGRSFPLHHFKFISQLPNVKLISLHKGEGLNQLQSIDFNIKAFGSSFDSGTDAFLDTAAVMANCDLIITSDTSIAHLAGALGRPTWVVLKQFPDWRWMLDGSTTPWYPNMKLYRQTKFGNWDSVFDRINRDLSLLLTEKNAYGLMTGN